MPEPQGIGNQRAAPHSFAADRVQISPLTEQAPSLAPREMDSQRWSRGFSMAGGLGRTCRQDWTCTLVLWPAPLQNRYKGRRKKGEEKRNEIRDDRGPDAGVVGSCGNA